MLRFRLQQVMSLAIVAGLVSVGVVTGMVVSPLQAQSTYARIGYVDVQKAIQAHPQYQSVMSQIQAFKQAKMEELAAMQNAAQTEEQRRRVAERVYAIPEEVAAEGQRLTAPIVEAVIDATKAIGQESGIEVILEGGSVMYGGLDLTPLVINRLQGR